MSNTNKKKRVKKKKQAKLDTVLKLLRHMDKLGHCGGVSCRAHPYSKNKIDCPLKISDGGCLNLEAGVTVKQLIDQYEKLEYLEKLK